METSVRPPAHSDCPAACYAGILSLPAIDKRQWMKREYHRWHSPRLGIELGVVVYGHYGPPLLGFPTSAGDETELEGQSMVGALADFIEAGRVKFFTINSINGLSFYNKGAHPFHRSYVQSVFDSYLREEVVPFIWNNCQSPGIAISTMGASFGAYHAANSLFKHPDVINAGHGEAALDDIGVLEERICSMVRAEGSAHRGDGDAGRLAVVPDEGNDFFTQVGVKNRLDVTAMKRMRALVVKAESIDGVNGEEFHSSGFNEVRQRADHALAFEFRLVAGAGGKTQ